MSVRRTDSLKGMSDRLVDPDDVLTREESALVSKARKEMREGKYIPLTKLAYFAHHLKRRKA